MKKWLLGLLTAMMAVSLAACTPTTDKQKETKSAEEVQAQIEAQTTGGASDQGTGSKRSSGCYYFYISQGRR